MIDAGEDPKFIARRIMIHASEDVGNATRRRFWWRMPRLSLPRSLAIPSAALTWLRLHSMCAWRQNPTRVRLRSMRRWPISILVGFARCRVICAIAIARAAMNTVCISIHMIIPRLVDQRYLPEGLERGVFWQLPAAVGRMARRAKRTRPQRECTEVAADNFVPRCCSWHVRSPLGTMKSVCISILPGGLYESHSNRPAAARRCRRVGHR